MISNKEARNVTVKVEGDLLVINGIIVPYDQQVIRSKDILFVTDLGIEVPIDKQLRDFDQYYFHFLLKQQIVSQLEANHISIGLGILHELPYLQSQHYAYIFRKLSMAKLIKILMDDRFYKFIWSKLQKFGKVKRQRQDIEKMIDYLDQPYKRMIYMLVKLEEDIGQLKQAFQSTAYHLILSMMAHPNFIFQLAYSDNEHRIIKDNFVKNIYYFTISFQYLLKISQEITQQRNYCKDFTLKSFVFNNQCLNLIGKNFKKIYQKSPKDLILILSLIITQNPTQFWKFLYTTSQSLQIQRQKEQIRINNIIIFRQFILHNYFSNDFHIWDQSIYILEILSMKENEADQILLDILEDLVRFQLKNDVIDLIISFIDKRYKNNDKKMPQLKIFASSFLHSISLKISQLYNNYLSKSKKHQKYKCKSLTNLLLIPKFPKINSKLLCAYLRFNLFQDMNSLNLQKRLQELLIMTRGRSGVIEGARRILIKSIKANLINQQIKNNKKNGGKQFNLHKNPKKQLLKKMISDDL